MKKTKTNAAYVWGFTGSLLVMSGLFFSLPLQTFSDTENRTLQGKPELTWNNLWNKKFSEQTESYLTDHFPFRDNWLSIKSAMEQLRLQQENNGIYKGKDGYLFEKFDKPDFEQIKDLTDAVRAFAKAHPNTDISFLLAPNSVGVYAERLPWLAETYPQTVVNDYIAKQLADSLNFMNGFNILKPHAADERPIYYRTDHHWTSYGAYLAYVAYAEQMGWTPLPESEFRIETVTSDFFGSYHTRSQFSGLKPDLIQVYKPNNQASTQMYVADSDETSGSMYDDSYLAKKDKYSYFLGGVHALMTLTTNIDPAYADKEKLLVIKDSYAHSMLPFLTQHVSEIHVIDTRYYNGSIADYMEQNGIADVLLLFNTSTFITDRNLLKLNF
jgi:alginate O-acetyltransferase complex protein AlgJ